jgi:hypothetical protein
MLMFYWLAEGTGGAAPSGIKFPGLGCTRIWIFPVPPSVAGWASAHVPQSRNRVQMLRCEVCRLGCTGCTPSRANCPWPWRMHGRGHKRQAPITLQPRRTHVGVLACIPSASKLLHLLAPSRTQESKQQVHLPILQERACENLSMTLMKGKSKAVCGRRGLYTLAWCWTAGPVGPNTVLDSMRVMIVFDIIILCEGRNHLQSKLEKNVSSLGRNEAKLFFSMNKKGRESGPVALLWL